MFDIGWSELLIIGALALIVVGPKDLPRMLREVGRYAGKARSMAREFQRSMDDAARETELKDLRELRDAAKDLKNLNRPVIDPLKTHKSAVKTPVAEPRAASAVEPPAPEPAAPEPAASPAAPAAAAASKGDAA